MKRLLIAEGYRLEYGWFLMRFQAHIRLRSKGFDQTVVLCEKDRFGVVADFAEQCPTIGTTHPGGFGKDVEVVWVHAKEVVGRKGLKQQFRQYGERDQWRHARNGIVVHAREDNRKVIGERNWPRESWNELCWEIPRRYKRPVFSIGRLGGSYCPEGAEDYRDYPLSIMSNCLAAARLCVGSSSGPMHLASLCGCPHLVWTEPGKKWDLGEQVGSNRQRYTDVWNPLKTPAYILEKEGWQPSVGTVLKEIGRILKHG